MTVLITGVAGFIGSTLAEKIKNKYSIIGIDNPDYKYALGNKNNIPEGIEYIQCDIRDSKTIEQIILKNDIKVVYHFAAITDKSNKDEFALEEVNFNATKNLMQICTGINIPFIYASCGSVYDNKITTPKNLYTLSKFNFDKLVQENSPQMVCGLRFFNVFGLNESYKGASASIPFKIFKKIENKNKKFLTTNTIKLSNKNKEKDFIYIDDAINNIIALTGQTGIFDIGSGKTEPIKNIVHYINKHTLFNFKIKSNKKEKDFNIAKANNPIKASFSLQDGIKEMIKNFKNITPLKKVKILLLGDIILDYFYNGISNSFSSESSVPIIELEKQHPDFKLGGAGNVIQNLLSLGAEVHYVGSYDPNSEDMSKIMGMFQSDKIFKDLSFHNILSDNLFSKKIRVVSNGKQNVRMDYDQQSKFSPEECKLVFGSVKKLISENDFEYAIFSDCNKGQLSYSVPGMIHMLKDAGVKSLVTPASKDLTKYRGSFILKPNLNEIKEFLGDEYFLNIKDFLQRADIENVIVSLHKDGLILYDSKRTTKPCYLKTKEVDIYDTTSVECVTLATLGYCLSNGFELKDAMLKANKAVDIVMKHKGVYALSPADVIKILN